MKRLLALIFFALLWSAPSQAQVFIVTSCGSVPASQATLVAGRSGMMFIDVNGNLCTAASVSASITGFPTAQTTGTPISVTTTSATGTLPTGAVVVASNVGATNGAYCKLGATATTSDQLIPPNSWFAFTVGGNTQLSCITSTSTTTVNMVGGSGLPTGSGGGGGGSGGGGAITAASGSYASGALSVGAGTDGWDATQGAKADAVCGTATGTCSMAALVKFLNTSASTPLNNSSVAINVSTATTTQLVAISASTLIYVTSFDVIAGGTGNITFVYGTGSNCGTGTTSLTGPYNLTAQAGISKGSGIGTVLKVPAGNALCVTTSAAVQMSGSVSYQQF